MRLFWTRVANALALVSGFAALQYEVLWARQLSELLGVHSLYIPCTAARAARRGWPRRLSLTCSETLGYSSPSTVVRAVLRCSV